MRVALVSVLLCSATVLAASPPAGEHDPCELYGSPHGHGTGDGHAHSHDAGDAYAMCWQPGYQRQDWSAGQGTIPSYADALLMPQYRTLTITGDAQFEAPKWTPASAPAPSIPGSGTPEDPYILEGLHVTHSLSITDTSACFVVRGNYIGFDSAFMHGGGNGLYTPAKLRLSYNGECVHAHHNFASDLRVNVNQEHTAYATGGLIEQNHFEFVGQLRHYGGAFAHNTIGYPDGTGMTQFIQSLDNDADARVAHRVLNVDGFNQGTIHNNTIYGSVDLDFHGHWHGTGFFAPRSHHHDPHSHDHHMADHAQRWASVSFADNLIHDPDGYGLRYEDKEHRADDRTATSDPSPHLNEPHRHQTHVVLARNTIIDGGLAIETFNAERIEALQPDGSPTPIDPATGQPMLIDYHPWRNDGWLDILDNDVTVHQRLPYAQPWMSPFDQRYGLLLQQVREADTQLRGNSITLQPLEAADLAALGGWSPPHLVDDLTGGPATTFLAFLDASQLDLRGAIPEPTTRLPAGLSAQQAAGLAYADLATYRALSLQGAADGHFDIHGNTVTGPWGCGFHAIALESDATMDTSGNQMDGATRQPTCGMDGGAFGP
ncbi:MAG: hypothetical protein ACPGQL_01880 [Thermoplasmatota archaeon]